jgi:hypothetical protein
MDALISGQPHLRLTTGSPIAVMHGAPPKRSINNFYERDTLLINYAVKLMRVGDTQAQHFVQITVKFVQMHSTDHYAFTTAE